MATTEGVQPAPADTPRSVEDRFLAIMDQQAPSREQPQDTPQPEPTPEEQPEGEQEAAPASEQPVEDSEEVDFEGDRYLVPKTIKEALLRQADYTRKTQEVSEMRRLVESQSKLMQEQQALQAETSQEQEQLALIETRIKQYKQVDVTEMDPKQILLLSRELDQLKDARADLTKVIEGKRAQFQHRINQQLETLRTEGDKALRNAIPGWSTDLAKKVSETAVTYGFTPEELSNVYDHRYVRVLHDAYQWRQLQASKPEINKRVESVKGVARPASRNINPETQTKANLKRALKLTQDPAKRQEIAKELFLTKIR